MHELGKQTTISPNADVEVLSRNSNDQNFKRETQMINSHNVDNQLGIQTSLFSPYKVAFPVT